MATSVYLLSTAVMTALGVAVVAWIHGARRWRRVSGRYRAGETEREALPGERAARKLGRSQTAWLFAFLLLALALPAGALLAVVGDVGTTAVLVVLGAVVGLYVLVGAVATALESGHAPARAAFEGTALFGLLLVAVVAAKLLTSA